MICKHSTTDNSFLLEVRTGLNTQQLDSLGGSLSDPPQAETQTLFSPRQQSTVLKSRNELCIVPFVWVIMTSRG